MAGVLTAWDIARAVAEGGWEERLEHVMTRRVVSAAPSALIADIVHDLEQHRISAMPVVEDGRVLGMINSDLLAQRYFPQLLQAQGAE
jgi:CBS domain-containing protein